MNVVYLENVFITMIKVPSSANQDVEGAFKKWMGRGMFATGKNT